MKKFIAILTICLFIPFISGCVVDDGKVDCTKNPNHEECKEQGGEITPPENTPSEYDKYIESLKSIVDIEKYKIFERYGDFTEEAENYVYFGTYPGREVTNEELIQKLEQITETNEFGYISVEGLDFVKVVIKNTYNSLEIGDEEYENSTKYKIGTTHYFLVEPILWRVLTYNPDTDQAFLITNNILDAKMFVNETNDRFIDGRVIYPSNYEYSDIRKWCNNDFFKQAFTTTEQELVQLTKISNKFKVYNYEYPDDRDTEDYVYLPSFKEMTNKLYGFEETGIFSYSRFSIPSDYASAKGVYTSNLDASLPDSGLYLLRSGYEFLKSFAYFVKFDGFALNPYYVNSPSTGVRLCTRVTLADAE